MKSKQIQLNNKVGLYMRLSKDDERQGESLSIENQRNILTKYAQERGWTVIDEYVDDGYSGTNFDRPQVQRLLEDAKTGKIDTIIVKDLSRFGRNYIFVGQYVDYIFPIYNIRFIAISDNVDTANVNSAGMDMMPIMNIFNEWHSANTSKKIRAVTEANAKAGKYRSTHAPYGYVKGTGDKCLPVIDEPAATIVRRIFEMRATGKTLNEIYTVLNNEKVPIPAVYLYEKFGVTNKKPNKNLWADSILRSILKNPMYLGHLIRLRYTTVSYKNRRRTNREPIVFPNAFEPIVTQELWDKCREIEESVASHGKHTSRGTMHVLSGLMFCADGGVRGMEISLPFSVAADVENADVSVLVCSMNARQRQEGEIDAEATLKIGFKEHKTVRAKFVCAAEEGTEVPVSDCAVSVFIPAAGDGLWELSKSLKKSPEEVAENNPDLEFPVKEGQRVVIYRKKALNM